MASRKHNVTYTHGSDANGPHYTWTCSCGETATTRERFRASHRQAGDAHAGTRGTFTDAGFSAEVPPAYQALADRIGVHPRAPGRSLT
jgi:hypothetical protein